MDQSTNDLTNALVNLKQQNAAWQLLAARRAPLVIACLKALFESRDASIPVDDMEQALAGMLAEHANHADFDVGEDYLVEARGELRQWIKRRLVIERERRLIATDELQQVLRFVESLQARIMTSTASRLATVQREISRVAVALNPDQATRERAIRQQISELEQELADVTAGKFEVLEGSQAEEAIREVYDLALSLRADFRRVEDSFRASDRALRQSIISQDQHRGEIVDRLLDTHDELLQTPEGQTFKGFHEQLTRQTELDRMKIQLKEIARNPITDKALSRTQRTDLTWLLIRLISESGSVIKARAASERDVKSFIKSGLATEHHRVGQLLNEVMEAALAVDWSRQETRRRRSSLPFVGVEVANLPLVERLRFKAPDDTDSDPLQLATQQASLDDVEDDFWAAFDTLDRQALFDETRALLAKNGSAMSIGEIAAQLPPTHDLESIAFWLSLARQAELPFEQANETIDISRDDGSTLRFMLPRVALTAEALHAVQWET
ncbi:MAG: DUF3375 domain-containing protein [Pseudomonadota bacterium]